VTSRRALVASIPLLVVLSCGKRDAGVSPAATAASTNASVAKAEGSAHTEEATKPGAPAPSGSATAEAAPDLAPPTKACRALTVKGVVTREDGQKVVTGDLLDHPLWLTMAPGAELAVKHTETTREVVFHGPAKLLPCERGEERFMITLGHALTAATAGARPGAEVLIGTPLGAVTYGDGKLDIQVEKNGLSVRADAGEAYIFGTDAPPADGTGEAGKKVPAGKRDDVKAAAVDVKALVATCDASATASEARGREVLGSGSPLPLGVRAAAHARARKAARIHCAIAEAALGTLENGEKRDDLARVVSRSEARWRGLPSLRPPSHD
jgi:hypothetical protein